MLSSSSPKLTSSGHLNCTASANTCRKLALPSVVFVKSSWSKTNKTSCWRSVMMTSLRNHLLQERHAESLCTSHSHTAFIHVVSDNQDELQNFCEFLAFSEFNGSSSKCGQVLETDRKVMRHGSLTVVDVITMKIFCSITRVSSSHFSSKLDLNRIDLSRSSYPGMELSSNMNWSGRLRSS